MQCVVLAGGLGLRMRAVTGTTPKALVRVGGVPFADLQLRRLAEEGVREVVYCIGYRGDALREHVGDGRRFGLSVVYVDDGRALRGTAGALRLAADEGVLDEAFSVVYGDSYLPIAYAPVWRAFRETALPALMTVLRNDDRWDASNAAFEEGRVVRYEKSGGRGQGALHWIDYGLSVLARTVVEEHVRRGAVADLTDVYQTLSRQGLLAGYEVRERFYEVGSPAGLADLERHLHGEGDRSH